MKRRKLSSSSALRSSLPSATRALLNLCFLVLVLLLPTSSTSQRALPPLPSGELSEPQLSIASSSPVASPSSLPSSPSSSPAAASSASPASSASVSLFLVRSGPTQREAGEEADRREEDGARGGSPSRALPEGPLPVSVSSHTLLAATEQIVPSMKRSSRLLRQAQPEAEEHEKGENEKGEHEKRTASPDGIFLTSFGADISPSHLQIHTVFSREGDGEAGEQAL
ncbi:putative transmembrane protein [Toxoplasma gondii TgCatPRC2]|uniref:Putative transmembrane protein n=1 Tax=Toxoplasma gondii TgCatPRC2 TaxID=1130821 RepID=A0A151HM29_TOXGO|nr:putative transmembrane protein [Toxoplasma gondii TgCatPRC2]